MRRFRKFHIAHIAIVALIVLLIPTNTKINYKTNNYLINLTGPVDEKVEAAASMVGKLNIDKSPYYPKLDIYNFSPTKTILKLNKFKTYQQTSEYSCGAACALMTLNYFGISNVSENSLFKEMDIRSSDNRREDGSFGATTESIVNVFKNRGFSVSSSLDTSDDEGYSFSNPNEFSIYVIKNIKQGNVIITENIEWGGHWMVIVGYDNMGTKTLEDDVLVFADPYDTTDHHQDGYIVRSFLRYFYEWFDHDVLPKNQSIQQYVTVSKKK